MDSFMRRKLNFTLRVDNFINVQRMRVWKKPPSSERKKSVHVSEDGTCKAIDSNVS